MSDPTENLFFTHGREDLGLLLDLKLGLVFLWPVRPDWNQPLYQKPGEQRRAVMQRLGERQDIGASSSEP